MESGREKKRTDLKKKEDAMLDYVQDIGNCLFLFRKHDNHRGRQIGYTAGL
jgi:hypothetical protein